MNSDSTRIELNWFGLNGGHAIIEFVTEIPRTIPWLRRKWLSDCTWSIMRNIPNNWFVRKLKYSPTPSRNYSSVGNAAVPYRCIWHDIWIMAAEVPWRKVNQLISSSLQFQVNSGLNRSDVTFHVAKTGRLFLSNAILIFTLIHSNEDRDDVKKSKTLLKKLTKNFLGGV